MIKEANNYYYCLLLLSLLIPFSKPCGFVKGKLYLFSELYCGTNIESERRPPSYLLLKDILSQQKSFNSTSFPNCWKPGAFDTPPPPCCLLLPYLTTQGLVHRWQLALELSAARVYLSISRYVKELLVASAAPGFHTRELKWIFLLWQVSSSLIIEWS